MDLRAPDLSASASKSLDFDPALYDSLVDWKTRLANETPFYRELFEEHGVRSVLDCACGTGHHAALFHSWGLKTEGADIDPRMIAHCRDTFGKQDNLRWEIRGFDQPCNPPGQFDAVVCVGNSLALAIDLEQVHRAIKAMLSSVGAQGMVIIQVVNLWHLSEGLTQWSKAKRFTVQGRDHLSLKGVHRVGSRGFIDLIDIELEGDAVESRVVSPAFLGLEAADLIAAARAGGAGSVDLYGSFQRAPYNREMSKDIVMILFK